MQKNKNIKASELNSFNLCLALLWHKMYLASFFSFFLVWWLTIST